MRPRSAQILFFATLLSLVLFGAPGQAVVFAEDSASNTVMIDFPIGDVEIRHLESSRGMILDVTSRPISLKARRLYFGDGKHAVKYEGSRFGMRTPTGVVKVGAIRIKNGQTIKTTPTTLKKWGSKPNEVYILVLNIKFESE